MRRKREVRKKRNEAKENKNKRNKKTENEAAEIMRPAPKWKRLRYPTAGEKINGTQEAQQVRERERERESVSDKG